MHTLSAVEVHADDWKVPDGHVVVLHGEHTLFVVGVHAVDSYVPDPHDALHEVHTPFNIYCPAGHCVQTPFTLYCPTGHVHSLFVVGVQAVISCVPAAHAALHGEHTLSVVCVHAVDSYVPAVHGGAQSNSP